MVQLALVSPIGPNFTIYEANQKVFINVARGRRAKPATLMSLYTRPLGISNAKRQTSHLCQNGAIPAEVKHWYMNLSVETDPVSKDVVNN